MLLPNVLQALPVSLSQTIRHFAEHLEQSLAGALINAPPNLAVVKLIGMIGDGMQLIFFQSPENSPSH